MLCRSIFPFQQSYIAPPQPTMLVRVILVIASTYQTCKWYPRSDIQGQISQAGLAKDHGLENSAIIGSNYGSSINNICQW